LSRYCPGADALAPALAVAHFSNSAFESDLLLSASYLSKSAWVAVASAIFTSAMVSAPFLSASALANTSTLASTEAAAAGAAGVVGCAEVGGAAGVDDVVTCASAGAASTMAVAEIRRVFIICWVPLLVCSGSPLDTRRP